MCSTSTCEASSVTAAAVTRSPSRTVAAGHAAEARATSSRPRSTLGPTANPAIAGTAVRAASLRLAHRVADTAIVNGVPFSAGSIPHGIPSAPPER